MKMFRHQTAALVCAPAFVVGTAGSPDAAGARQSDAVSEQPDLERFFDDDGTIETMATAGAILKELGVLPASAT